MLGDNVRITDVAYRGFGDVGRVVRVSEKILRDGSVEPQVLVSFQKTNMKLWVRASLVEVVESHVHSADDDEVPMIDICDTVLGRGFRFGEAWATPLQP